MTNRIGQVKAFALRLAGNLTALYSPRRLPAASRTGVETGCSMEMQFSADGACTLLPQDSLTSALAHVAHPAGESLYASGSTDTKASSPQQIISPFSWFRVPRRPARQMLDETMPLREALELVPVPILTVDAENLITFANGGAVELFGRSQDEMIGASIEVLFPPAVDCEGHRAVDHLSTTGERPERVLVRQLVASRRRGGDFPAEIRIVRVKAHSQEAQIVAISDRSDCSELELSRNELAHLARVSSLGELAGSLAHELNQPLTAILSNAEAAQRLVNLGASKNAELREALQDIVADDCRASEVIQRIRTLVRNGNIEMKPLDLGTVVADVAALVRSDAMVRGVHVTFYVEDALTMVRGDRVQLQQVLLNLLLNGFDAMQARAPAERVVELAVHRASDGGAHITVKDSGNGLPADHIDKVFLPFFTTKPQGLGLGLSISRTIVNAHGGCMWAEKNDGPGACFHITFPPRQTYGGIAGANDHESA
ncbi:two-component system sensor histidine kinase NtrB [Paraburkholderia sp. RL17-381-BIF-C]|uniref:two-component system sensor histidine kinase NtrB n=1 Tax=Paraburkholderia sp. RL17-381-BIF-C TaxID=3031635 RepID=UPI0038BBE2E9